MESLTTRDTMIPALLITIAGALVVASALLGLAAVIRSGQISREERDAQVDMPRR